MKQRNSFLWGILLCLLFVAVPSTVQAKKYFDWDAYMGEQNEDKENSPVIDVLDLKQVDILDVLKLISQKSGLNIIAGQDVSGTVTVYLREMKTLDALDIIVEAYNWAYVKEGDVIKVISQQTFEKKYGHKYGEKLDTRLFQLLYVHASDVLAVLNQMKSESGKIVSDEKSNTIILVDTKEKLKEMAGIIRQIDVATQTRVFHLNYAQAEELANKVVEILTPQVGTMKFDKRSNKIVVSDTRVKLDKIAKIVEAFDQKDKGVLIEAKIIQIALEDEHKMGVDWQGIVANYHNMTVTSNFDILGDTEKRGQLGIGTIDEDNYTFLIQALDEVGKTDLLSSPRITTINNEEAKILVGMTEPYVTTTTTTPESGPPTTAETVNFIEVGVKLNVTPTIHNDGFITMKIKPEVSSVVDNLTTSNNNVIPVIESSEAETTVIVKDGVTIVIGGLIKEENISSQKKVPVLGDIPFMGKMFQNESSSVKKTEIVIFMKPTIVDGDIPHQVIAETRL